MTIRSGFFNSINGDRKYDARRFAEYFATFIGNGIFPNPSTNLQVIANDDMTVTIKPGKAWINGFIVINDDDYILELDISDGLLSRIDRIVARYDVVDREIRLEVKKGTFASNPVAPELQRDYDAFELGLANVLVNKNANSIYQMDITDLRFLSEYCGIVHGLVDQVDVSTIYNQYSQEFRLWLETLKDALDEETATNLYAMITVTTDNLDTLEQDFNEHLADIASDLYFGHVKVDNKTIIINENGVISQYQPSFNIFDNGILGQLFGGMEEGYKKGTGSVGFSDAISVSATAASTQVGILSIPIDLSHINKLYIEWENTGYEKNNVSAFFVDKTKAGTKLNFYAKIEKNNNFSKGIDFLDVSNLYGLHYLKLQADSSYAQGSSLIKVYRLWGE